MGLLELAGIVGLSDTFNDYYLVVVGGAITITGIHGRCIGHRH